jgi:hypothetical protein
MMKEPEDRARVSGVRHVVREVTGRYRTPADPRAVGQAWLLIVLALMFLLMRQHDLRDEVRDLTAAGSRDQLNTVLADTARELGLDVRPEDLRGTPLTCTPQGARAGQGESYVLRALQGPPMVGVDGPLSQVRFLWEELGYEVSDRTTDDVHGLTAATPDGGSIYIVTSPGGTTLAGESACIATSTEAPTP